MNEEIHVNTEEHSEVAVSKQIDNQKETNSEHLIEEQSDDSAVDNVCIYGLSFRNKRGVFTVKDELNKYRIDDQLVVRTCRGKEVAKVKYVQLNKMLDREREIIIKDILRLVNQEDLDVERRNREKEKSAMEIAQKKSAG